MYIHLAHLLSYPDSRYKQYLDDLIQSLGSDLATTRKLEPFSDFINQSEIKVVEELFTRTFDMNPATCLEVGWHLYGEDYKRGEFLAKMRRALVQEKVAESVELPDHMSHCLKLLANLELHEARGFAQEYLLPSISKILEGLEQDNPFRYPIDALKSLLVNRLGADPTAKENTRLYDLEGVG